MNIQEIKDTISRNHMVYWKSLAYKASISSFNGQLYIDGPNGHRIGMESDKGEMINAYPSDFFAISSGGHFRLVSVAMAVSLYNQGKEVYKIYDEDSEGLVESIEDIHLAEEREIDLGVEIGETILLQDCQTFDVVFNDSENSNNQGFSISMSRCLDFIKTWNNGVGAGYFGDYKGGIVSIICNETQGTVYSTKIK